MKRLLLTLLLASSFTPSQATQDTNNGIHIIGLATAAGIMNLGLSAWLAELKLQNSLFTRSLRTMPPDKAINIIGQSAKDNVYITLPIAITATFVLAGMGIAIKQATIKAVHGTRTAAVAVKDAAVKMYHTINNYYQTIQ